MADAGFRKPQGVTLLTKWNLLQACMCAPNLSQTAKLAFGRLLGHHNTETGQCNPSYATLAKGIGVSRRTAIDAVDALEADGWIKIQRGGGDTKGTAEGHTSNSFSFNWSRAPSAKNRTREVQEIAPPSADNDTTPSAETRTQTLEPLNKGRNTETGAVDTGETLETISAAEFRDLPDDLGSWLQDGDVIAEMPDGSRRRVVF